MLIDGLKAMGEGHSFENGAHLILPSLSYAYEENEQFIHRVWRLTSPAPVTIYPIIMRGSIDEKLHEIFSEKADASNLAIDGRLFTEPEHDIDMEWILNETIKAFDAAVATVDEQALVLQWETTHARQLRHANLQYHEHIENNAMFQEEMNHAVQALSIPSPTQLTVDTCRKQFREGTYRSDPITSSHIKSLTEKLRAKKRRSKKANHNQQYV